MNHYPHHIGDFNNATRHLTRLERSVYRDMLDLYYDTEQPLILDFEALCRKLLARSEEESTAVQQVLNEFFTETKQGWHHNRCEEVISEYKKGIGNKSAAGIASAAKREQKRLEMLEKLNTCSTPVQQTPNSDGSSVQLTITKTITKTKTNKNNPAAKKRGCDYSPEFEEAWIAYPARSGASKTDAFRAWSARLKDEPNTAVLLAGVRRYAAYVAAMGIEQQFVKQPATFFGPGLHYLADWTAAPQKQPGGAWWTSEATIIAKGMEVGVKSLPGEMRASLQARVQAAIDNGGAPPEPKLSRVVTQATPIPSVKSSPPMDELKAALRSKVVT